MRELEWVARTGRNLEGDKIDYRILVDLEDGRVMVGVSCPVDGLCDFECDFFIQGRFYQANRHYTNLESAKKFCEQQIQRYFAALESERDLPEFLK